MSAKAKNTIRSTLLIPTFLGIKILSPFLKAGHPLKRGLTFEKFVAGATPTSEAFGFMLSVSILCIAYAASLILSGKIPLGINCP